VKASPAVRAALSNVWEVLIVAIYGIRSGVAGLPATVLRAALR